MDKCINLHSTLVSKVEISHLWLLIIHSGILMYDLVFGQRKLQLFVNSVLLILFHSNIQPLLWCGSHLIRWIHQFMLHCMMHVQPLPIYHFHSQMKNNRLRKVWMRWQRYIINLQERFSSFIKRNGTNTDTSRNDSENLNSPFSYRLCFPCFSVILIIINLCHLCHVINIAIKWCKFSYFFSISTVTHFFEIACRECYAIKAEGKQL